MVCYDGARLTARSFGDMTKATRLLLHSISHPTRLLTLNSSAATALTSSSAPGHRRSITQDMAASPSGSRQQESDILHATKQKVITNNL